LLEVAERVCAVVAGYRRFTAIAEWVTDLPADIGMTVTGNQPILHEQLTGLLWRQTPEADRDTGRGHGRREIRTLKILSVAAGFEFPHAAQPTSPPRPATTPATPTAHWPYPASPNDFAGTLASGALLRSLRRRGPATVGERRYAEALRGSRAPRMRPRPKLNSSAGS
jgi:hypothetical protein